MANQDQSQPIRICIFARVSTTKQDWTRQIIDLREYAEKQNYQVTREIITKISGIKTRESRPDIKELIHSAEKGLFDKILIHEVSRLGRDANDIRNTIKSLHEIKIPIIFYSLGCIESLDHKGEESFVTNIILSIYSELAQEERRILSDRTISGLRAARLKGKTLGRPIGKLSASQLMQKHSKIVRLIEAGRTISEIAKLSGRGYNTVKRVALQLRSNK
jgi:DNA invertase Pin-like site-specific DNA recombinase